jgi:L-malate glycosyltransferase
MKILLAGDINSPHLEKWAVSLARCNFSIGVFSMSDPHRNWHLKHGIEIFCSRTIQASVFSSRITGKMKYLSFAKDLKKAVRLFQPDILHAHYASSYGLLGALCGFHPYVISVWGSDIESFARIPVIGSAIIRFNFSKADRILSTSQSMVSAIGRYTRKEILVTPFGTDTAVFCPAENKPDHKEIVIGTVKSLERTYGIDKLIRSFALLKQRNPSRDLRLLIVGGGSLAGDLKNLADELGVLEQTVLVGKVPYEEVPSYLNKLDIYVALSRRESFGVAVLEASSCGIPVVVSDSGGLPEVVADGETGFVVQGGDIGKTSDLLEMLITDPQLRTRMGTNGRNFVGKYFSLADSVSRMTDVYKKVVSEKS